MAKELQLKVGRLFDHYTVECNGPWLTATRQNDWVAVSLHRTRAQAKAAIAEIEARRVGVCC